jgi:hypothetical protein
VRRLDGPGGSFVCAELTQTIVKAMIQIQVANGSAREIFSAYERASSMNSSWAELIGSVQDDE